VKGVGKGVGKAASGVGSAAGGAVDGVKKTVSGVTEGKESERSDAMPAGDVGHDIHKRAVKAYNKRNPSTKVKEDYGYSEVYAGEQLDELSKGTMGSYVKKAAKDVEKRSYDQAELEADTWLSVPEKDPKIDKRHKGIGSAVKKLTKEETSRYHSYTEAYASMYSEGSVEDQMKVSQEYFKKRNARSDEEKEAEKKSEAASRAKTYAMHKKPDPYKARAGESD
tara:strand:+ start:2592 stop:3260 length:669 start_codon:yes stop_codon:yes gene_type:complete